jgi:hypothetical protein
MKLGVLIAIAVTAVVLIGTNPGTERYDEWAKHELAKSGAAGALISIILPSALIESATTRRNLLLFSLYETRVSDTYIVRTIGILASFVSLGSSGNPEQQRRAEASPAVPGRPQPVSRSAALPVPSADDFSEPKCLKAMVSKIEGRFLPTSENQLLAIGQEQAVESGTRDIAYCKQTVVLAKLDPISKTYIPVWQTDMAAPGLVFSDGYWHKQQFVQHADVRRVQVLPPPMDSQQQIFIYHHNEAVDGGFSAAEIVAFTTPFGNARTLLKVQQHGGMDIKIEDRVITINGYYIPNGGCNACGERRSVSLRFDPSVGQFAIENPDQRSAEFYRYLTRG